MALNPNSARNAVNSYTRKNDTDKAIAYPQFFTKVKFDVFRHIRNLSIDFIHPITVVSGSNRSGKTSALMAIACSHYNFDRANVTNGAWDRATWSHVVRFTQHDKQTVDWEYQVGYREGNNGPRLVRGFRRHITKKWGGVGKKEHQIGKPTEGHPGGGRHVCLIDLNRINPGRHFKLATFSRAYNASATALENRHAINEYLSYILESHYSISVLAEDADNKVYKFQVRANVDYSSFNTASGEDVLVNMLSQILRMPDYSLILIDELEIGLHPKIQRRLIDVIYCISQKQHKQFIITSHSYAVIDSVPQESHVFIENVNGSFVCKPKLTTYETLTRMDSIAFPVSMIYVEDEESKAIIDYAIKEVNEDNPGFTRLLKSIVVGSANDTYQYFKTRQKLQSQEKFFAHPACILDGDMKEQKNNNNSLMYPEEKDLFFHFSSEAPEKMLMRQYLNIHPHEALQYHVETSNPHCLLEKMVEQGLALNKKDALSKCLHEYRNSAEGCEHFESMKDFLKQLI